MATHEKSNTIYYGRSCQRGKSDNGDVCINGDASSQELVSITPLHLHVSLQASIIMTSVILRERSQESSNLHTHDTFKEEDDEFAATLRKAESLDYNNCMWLSSDVKIDAWFISLLSSKSRDILSTKATFFDGSIANPIEEASLVLDQRKEFEFFHENLEEKEVVSWLANDESSSVSSITDTTDHDHDHDHDHEHEHSFSSCSSSEYSSEVVDMEEIGTNKPLFWPSDWTSDWDSETKCDLFIMSPRKNMYKLDSEKGCNRMLLFDTHQKSSTKFDLKNTMKNKPSRFRKPTKTSTKIVPLDDEIDFGRLTEAKVVNESGPMDTKTKTKTPGLNDDLRLQVLNGKKDLDKGCSRKLEFSIGDEDDDTSEVVEVKPLTMKSVRKHRIVLEDLLLVDKLNVEGAIEEALGLDEFDGLEGLGSEFNKDGFSLIENF
ncbi:unnamed protein product [Lactuca saligna]|uniref:Uncharacterized protein n=1 Tax=Lactuca saligna TaxID=75948 RepID=A0AA35ZD51_LACSI|nr:unnamed protein product [Lactuca saligna]